MENNGGNDKPMTEGKDYGFEKQELRQQPLREARCRHCRSAILFETCFSLIDKSNA